MVRTELDALPMEEKTGLAYASRDKAMWNSRETFVAHSCGDDIHMASWLGTAKTLLGLKDRWHGTLMFIARPAEEAGAGAKAVLADGLFMRFEKPDFGFGLHDGAFAYGTLNYRAGIGSSNVDGLVIRFRGRGDHGAAPQETIDPVMIAARFLVDVQSVISREKDPTEFGVLSIGAIHGGTSSNIIPDDVLVLGTIRSFRPEVRARMLAGIERTARAAAAMSDAPAPDIAITETAKAIMNDPAVVENAAKVMKAAFGEKFKAAPPVIFSEDFSEFVNAGVPSMFFNIGVYEPERAATASNGTGPELPSNHSPLFRAGAEADHQNRHCGYDARCSQCFRSACSTQLRAGGVWDGTPIVSASWIGAATTPRIHGTGFHFHGYKFRLGLSLVDNREVEWAAASDWWRLRARRKRNDVEIAARLDRLAGRDRDDPGRHHCV